MGSVFRFLVRAFPALISLLFLLLFLSPIGVGIFNIGNAAGAVVSALLLCIFIFHKQFAALVSSLWGKLPGRIVLVIIGFLTAAAIIWAIAVSCLMIREMNDNPPNPNTTVVVLGCKVKDGAPSLMLKKRLDAAVSYLESEPEVKVIVSGGKGDDEIMSEAECMYRYLTDKGIAPSRIFREDKSVSTEENLSFSKKIIKENSLPEDITIITDGYHQLRADMLAERLGIKAYNISAHTSRWLVPTYWVREWFGVAYYIVRR